MRSSRILAFFAAFVVGFSPLWITGCPSTSRTPQATMFATLQAAAAGIDSFRSDYEAAYRAGDLDQAGLTKLDTAYNTANDAIIAATQALDAGTLLSMGDVNAAAKALFDLVLQIVPPKHQTNASKWRI